MVGKIRHVRQKLHQEAVRLDEPVGPRGSVLPPSLPGSPAAELPVSSGGAWKHERRVREGTMNLTQVRLTGVWQSGNSIKTLNIYQSKGSHVAGCRFIDPLQPLIYNNANHL